MKHRHFLGVATIWIILIGFQTRAVARIGETLWQCEDRYGQKTSVENGYTWFSKGGFEINAAFFDGMADAIGFRKERKNVLGTSEEMSGNEIQLLLDANSKGKNWVKDNVISMDQDWSTEDGTLKASYSSFKHVLVVATKEHIQRFSKAKAAEEATKLEGQ